MSLKKATPINYNLESLRLLVDENDSTTESCSEEMFY